MHQYVKRMVQTVSEKVQSFEHGEDVSEDKRSVNHKNRNSYRHLLMKSIIWELGIIIIQVYRYITYWAPCIQASHNSPPDMNKFSLNLAMRNHFTDRETEVACLQEITKLTIDFWTLHFLGTSLKTLEVCLLGQKRGQNHDGNEGQRDRMGSEGRY